MLPVSNVILVMDESGSFEALGAATIRANAINTLAKADREGKPVMLTVVDFAREVHVGPTQSASDPYPANVVHGSTALQRAFAAALIVGSSTTTRALDVGTLVLTITDGWNNEGGPKRSDLQAEREKRSNRQWSFGYIGPKDGGAAGVSSTYADPGSAALLDFDQDTMPVIEKLILQALDRFIAGRLAGQSTIHHLFTEEESVT